MTPAPNSCLKVATQALLSNTISEQEMGTCCDIRIKKGMTFGQEHVFFLERPQVVKWGVFVWIPFKGLGVDT